MRRTNGSTFLTLRLLCANAMAMVGFLLAFVVTRDPVVALAAAGVLGVIGFVASQVVVEYAAVNDESA